MLFYLVGLFRDEFEDFDDDPSRDKGEENHGDESEGFFEAF
jgi:hypothetical protein